MLEKYILVDLETASFTVESGIYEVALMVIENGKEIIRKHFGIIKDQSLIHLGKGQGYEECSNNVEFKTKFKKILTKYNYPLVAHNGAFDRKFLIYYDWLDENYKFYDSMRAIKYEIKDLNSYSLQSLADTFNLNIIQSHTAMDDVELLFKILKEVKPQKWFYIGESNRRKYTKYERLTALKEEYQLVDSMLTGKTIVFTGKSEYSRNELIKMAKEHGAIAKDSITKKTNLLVVGEQAGSKLNKAKDLDIDIISIEEFLKLISK